MRNLSLLLALSACVTLPETAPDVAPSPTPSPTSTLAPMSPSKGSYKEKVDGFYLDHFDVVADIPGCASTRGLYRGGQPRLTDSAWLKKLKSEGISVIVDLRNEAGSSERRAAEASGLTYRSLALRTVSESHPVGTAEKTIAEIERIKADFAAGRRVFIHCQRGEDRTGTVIGLLRDCGDDGFKDYKRYGGSYYRSLSTLRTEVEALRKKPAPTPSPTPTPSPRKRPALSWEQGHPERAAWSDALYRYLEQYWAYDDASDVTLIYPKWKSASRETKLQVMAEFWVAVSYYESSWNPKSASVDVGTQGDKGSWSIGLLQMSVNDQPNYGFRFGYSYEDLLTPAPNLHLALAIMQKQIQKRGRIMIPKGQPGLYWAVASPGGKYDKTSQIIARVQKAVP